MVLSVTVSMCLSDYVHDLILDSSVISPGMAFYFLGLFFDKVATTSTSATSSCSNTWVTKTSRNLLKHSLPNSEFPQLERGISDLLLSTLTTPAGTLLLYLAQKYLKTRLLLAHSQNECTVYIHTYISMVTWRLCIGLYAYDLIITVFHMKLSLNRCWVKRKGVCVCVRLFMHVCTEGPMPFRIRSVSNRNVECNVVTYSNLHNLHNYWWLYRQMCIVRLQDQSYFVFVLNPKACTGFIHCDVTFQYIGSK